MISKRYIYVVISILAVICGSWIYTEQPTPTFEINGINGSEGYQFPLPENVDRLSVQRLIIKNSSLLEVTDTWCRAFPFLHEISMVNIGIKKIAPNALVNCKHLTMFDVSYNNIEELPPELFMENEKLIVINMKGNKLKVIDDKMIENLHALQNLSLAQNFLTKFSFKGLEKMENLHYLNLQMNNLSDLNVEMMIETFPNLVYVDIRHNPIKNGSMRDFMKFADSNKRLTIDLLISDEQAPQVDEKEAKSALEVESKIMKGSGVNWSYVWSVLGGFLVFLVIFVFGICCLVEYITASKASLFNRNNTDSIPRIDTQSALLNSSLEDDMPINNDQIQNLETQNVQC